MVSCCGKTTKKSVSPQLISCGNIPCLPPKILNCNNGLQQLSRSIAAAIIIKNVWNIPACGETAVLYVQNISSVVVGGFLWSPDYGYFEITGFDPTTNKLLVTNSCTFGQQNIGKSVPKCSTMILVSSPGIETSGTIIYLASDFTAPAEDLCVTVQVTSTLTLNEGSNVQIGGAQYFLKEVLDDAAILICNTGSGFTVGTQIKAFNSEGQFQYQIISLGTSNMAQSSSSATDVLDFSTAFSVSTETSINLVNSGALESRVYWTAIMSYKGDVTGANTSQLFLANFFNITLPPSQLSTFTFGDSFYAQSNLARQLSRQTMRQGVFTLNPGQSHNFLAQSEVALSGGSFPIPIYDVTLNLTLTAFQNTD